MNYWSEEDLKDFEDNTDCIVECECPLEIRCEIDQSKATGQCADWLLSSFFRTR